jgi:hypothetical protein
MSELIPHPSMEASTRLLISFLCTLTLCAAATTATDNNKSHMNDQENYTTTFTVDQSPKEVFDAINNVRGWWSDEIEGTTDQLGEFKYRYKDIHRCTIRITELTAGKKVVWRVVENYFNFVKDKSEWKGTDIVFEITKKGGKTEVRFTHVGLSPQQECYGVCSDAWGTYINGSLRNLIAKGKGQPNQNEQLARKHGQE